MSIKKNNLEVNIKLINHIKEIRSNIRDNFYQKSSLKDLSHLKTFTIDDPETLEIDDAISLERIDNYYKLWIHIASPAAHINYNSEVDKYARNLISTIYLSNSNIYMFPEILINEVFSLSKNEKRASLSLGIIFNNDSSVSSFELVKSLIKPNYQLNYEEADELIYYAPKEEEDLSIISRILDKRKSIRKKLGAIEILEPYGKVIVNNNIPSIKVIDPTSSRLLISEAMILYGYLISNYTKKNNIPVPYRVQESKLIETNKNNDFSENNFLYNYKLKKAIGKTYYSIQPNRHYNLGLNNYLQATSPIRRYSDLLVHYQINRFLDNEILISKKEIEKNILSINSLGRENIIRYRDDQKIWLNKFLGKKTCSEYIVLFLEWINKYKNICIIYFLEYNISSICYLKTKIEINSGDKVSIKLITKKFKDMLYFEFN